MMAYATEKVAAAALISLIGGFLIYIALSASIENAATLWLLAVVCSGVVLGKIDNPTDRGVIKTTFVPAFVLATTPVAFFYIGTLIEFIKHPDSYSVEIAWQGVAVSPFDSRVIWGTVMLFGSTFVGSLMIMTISAVASRMLQVTAKTLFKLGPEGINRIKAIIIALIGVIVAILALKSVLVK